MNANQLQDAIGEIRDCYIAEAHPEWHPSYKPTKKWIAVLLAAIIIVFGLISCAPLLFSSLDGDDLSFDSAYKGNGIVEIYIENKSDNDLYFQKKLRLERWTEGLEIPAHGRISFSGTKISAHSTGTMTVDLSKAYDLEELEKPLVNDCYYLVLTNNAFAFGQDWICTVDFADNTWDEAVYPVPISPADADPALVGRAEEDLRDFFWETLLDTDKRMEVLSIYYETCAELIRNSGKTVIHPLSPAPFFLFDDPPAGTVFDRNIPEDMQYQLIGLHESSLDSYFFPIGASWEETAKVFEVIVPQQQADLFRVQGDAIQIGYVMIYDTQQCAIPDAYTFIRGQLIPASQLETHVVYRDDRYTAYLVTDYFFTDINAHIEAFRTWRRDLFFNDDVQNRIEAAYRYLQNGGIKLYPSEPESNGPAGQQSDGRPGGI